MKFTATLVLGGKTATGIEVPANVVDKLGGGKNALVKVTINGHTYPSAVSMRGGKALIPVSADNRAKAGIAAGDRITVDVELDTTKREIEIPSGLAKAFKSNPAAQRAFAALSNSGKKRHVLAIEGAKTEETRERRIAKAIAELTAG